MSKSPFPGMDPYLEQAWRDVHDSLCTYARDDLQPQLAGGLRARVDERLVVEQPLPRGRSVYGDVRIIQHPAPKSATAANAVAAGIAVAEPITLEISDETPTEGFIEIIDARTGGRVITVIEFLSPTNKLAGPGREQYRQKRVELQEGGVSLVEINLLRAGSFIGPFPREMLETENRTPYYATVHRGWVGRTYEYYPMPMDRRLPDIGIPLRPSEPAAVLDIQGLIDRVYQNGAYDQEIDYAIDPAPPLNEESAQWADGLLKMAGVRI